MGRGCVPPCTPLGYSGAAGIAGNGLTMRVEVTFCPRFTRLFRPLFMPICALVHALSMATWCGFVPCPAHWWGVYPTLPLPHYLYCSPTVLSYHCTILLLYCYPTAPHALTLGLIVIVICDSIAPRIRTCDTPPHIVLSIVLTFDSDIQNILTILKKERISDPLDILNFLTIQLAAARSSHARTRTYTYTGVRHMHLHARTGTHYARLHAHRTPRQKDCQRWGLKPVV